MNKRIMSFVAVVVLGGAVVGTYQVSAQSSQVNDGRDGSEQAEQAQSQALKPYATISEVQAKDIAQKAYTGNGKVTEVGLEKEGGVVVYAVEFTEADENEVDVKLDAKTGKVVKVENDRTETGEEPDDH